jgi:hypothetical protein
MGYIVHGRTQASTERRGTFRTDPPFMFIEELWAKSSVVAARPGTEWLLCTTYDGNLGVRDALALILVQRGIGVRKDLGDLTFVRAHCVEPRIPIREDQWFLWLGRPEVANGSRYGEITHHVATESAATFKNPSSGALGNSFSYGRRAFSGVSDEGDFSTDFGWIKYVHAEIGGVEVRVLVVMGMHTPSTACIAKITSEQALLAAAAEEARALVRDPTGHDPRRGFEVCFRLTRRPGIPLTDIAKRGKIGLPFTASVVAVSMPRDDGAWGTWIAEPSFRVEDDAPGRGGYVIIDTQRVRLPEAKYRVMKAFHEQRGFLATEDLCRERGWTEQTLRSKLSEIRGTLRSAGVLQDAEIFRAVTVEGRSGYVLDLGGSDEVRQQGA